MRLLRYSETDGFPAGRAYRYSRVRAVASAAVVLAGSAVCAVLAPGRSWILWYASIALAFILLIFQRTITARFRPTNWLVRTAGDGLLIKFRSYLNHHLPETDPTVLFLAYSEVRSVRMVRERMKVTDTQGGRSIRSVRLIEFDLACDPAPLVHALDVERAQRGPAEKHWYGTTATLYQHYPVRLVSPSFLQLEWAVAPSCTSFLRALSEYLKIEAPTVVSDDFTNLQTLTQAEQEASLRRLAENGQRVTAIYAVRRLYGCSLSEAVGFLDGLVRPTKVNE